MITINLLLIVLAFVCAILGTFGANLGKNAAGNPRFTPNWIALSLAFYFAAMLVRG